MTADWSSFIFLVRLGDMTCANDDACSTTDRGLNHCVTACQPWSPFPGSALRILRTKVATSPRVHETRAAALAELGCWTSRYLFLRGLHRVALEPVQLGDFSQQRAALPMTRLLHIPPPEWRSLRSRHGSLQIAEGDASPLLCGSGADRAASSPLPRWFVRRGLGGRCTASELDLLPTPAQSQGDGALRGLAPWAPLPSW